VRTRGPGSESSLAMSDRPASECLAHQSEAPSRWRRRRDVPLQCGSTKVAGGVGGGRVRAPRSNPRETKFQDGGKHLGSPEAIALRGAVAEAGLGRFCAMSGSLQPLRREGPTTRVLGSNDEEGSSHPCEPFAHELSARASGSGRAGAARALLRGAHRERGLRGPVSGEDRTLAPVCSRVVRVAEVDRRRLAQRHAESIPS